MKIKIRKKDEVNRLRPGGFYPFLKVTDKDEGTRNKAKAVFHELQKSEEAIVDFNGENEETFFALYPEFMLVEKEDKSKKKDKGLNLSESFTSEEDKENEGSDI